MLQPIFLYLTICSNLFNYITVAKFLTYTIIYFFNFYIQTNLVNAVLLRRNSINAYISYESLLPETFP